MFERFLMIFLVNSFRKKSDSRKSSGSKANNKRSTITQSDMTSQMQLSAADDSHDSNSTSTTSSKFNWYLDGIDKDLSFVF